MSLLEVKNLKVHFPVRHGLFSRAHETVKAVDDVSFAIEPGETVGLVGESGCGKSTLGRAIMRLVEPTAGEIFLHGEEFDPIGWRRPACPPAEIPDDFSGPIRFAQSPDDGGGYHRRGLGYSSIGGQPQGAAETHCGIIKGRGAERDHAQRYPHEFSGGQRQRIGIARALAVEPELIVCDEPVSALDVSVQAQIINLLQDLQQQRGMAYLFIAHDLAVVEHISRRVMVMYLGKIVEQAAAGEILRVRPASLYAGAHFRRAGSGPRHQTPADYFARRRAFAHSSAQRLSVSPALPHCRGPVQNGNSPFGEIWGGPLYRLPSGGNAHRGPLIPMSVQAEIKARRTFDLGPGASEAHTRSGLQRASNAARGQKDKRMSLIWNANWNKWSGLDSRIWRQRPRDRSVSWPVRVSILLSLAPSTPSTRSILSIP